MKIFWLEDELLLKMKMDILNNVILELSKREESYKMDAQVPIGAYITLDVDVFFFCSYAKWNLIFMCI